MFNASKDSSHFTREWRLGIYRETWTLGKVPFFVKKHHVFICCSLGVSNSFSRHVRQRYEDHFGPVNRHLPVANHSLILLDSPAIVDEDYMRAGHGTSFEEWIPLRDGAIEFVKGLAVGPYALSFHINVKLTSSRNIEEQLGPVILFSHIPLHRAESKKCGPLRERGTIHRGVGLGWQKTLGKQTSSFLLEQLRPTIIFRYALSLDSRPSNILKGDLQRRRS